MSLEKRINDLKQMTNEVAEAIYKIVMECFENDKPYPYNQIKQLLKKYERVYDKLWFKKYFSLTNDLLCKINPERKEILKNLEFYSPNDVLDRGHQRVVNYFVLSDIKYIPTDEVSKNKIYDKLVPIIKNFKLGQIETIYKFLKANVCSLVYDAGVPLDDDWDVFFQQMFVEIIISKFLNSQHKYGLDDNIYKNPLYEIEQYYIYEKICRECFNEPVLYLECKTKNKSKQK